MRYIDNNNFLRINNVLTNDNRYSLAKDHKNYTFFDLDQKPAWQADVPLTYSYNLSTDGVTYEMKDLTTLYGAYFFLSDLKVDHTRESQKFLDVLS